MRIPSPRSHIEDELPPPWLATITLDNVSEGNPSSTNDRLAAIPNIISTLAAEGYPSNGVLLFPGGWLDAGQTVPDAAYCARAATALLPALEGTGHTVCFGIDGGMDAEGFARDQLALAVREGAGICAMGRKFAPSPQEVGHVSLCGDYSGGECGYPRTFTPGGTTSFAWGDFTSGPMAGHSGTKGIATNPAGDYNSSELGWMASPVLDMSGYGKSSIAIQWWDWKEIESATFDWARLDVTKDGGVYPDWFITHEDIIKGSRFTFQLGETVLRK